MSTFGQEWKKALGNIPSAITDALANEVATVVKKAIVESARENVYDAYTPDFLSRGINDYSLLDEDAILINVSGDELTAEQVSPFQQLWGGERPAESLSDVIESGDPRFNMGKAGARKFMTPAKDAVIDSGEAERALIAGLQRNGIDTTGMTFEFK
jgi:hypothetical protein